MCLRHLITCANISNCGVHIESSTILETKTDIEDTQACILVYFSQGTAAS